MNLFKKKPLPLTLQEYKVGKIRFEFDTMFLNFLLFFSFPLAAAFSIPRVVTTAKSVLLLMVVCFIVSIILVQLFNRHRVRKARRLGFGPSLKLNTFIIKDKNVNEEIKFKFWELINKELNEEEKEIFKLLLDDFSGSIEDLILVAKDFGPEKVKIK